MRWLHFILSHSIFISCCAAGLCCQTYILLDKPIDLSIVLLISFATLGAYNFYWLTSKLSYQGKTQLALVLATSKSNIAMLFVSAAAVIFYIIQHPDIIPLILVAVVLTFLYSVPRLPFGSSSMVRKLGFVKPLLLAATWTYVTLLIPLYASSSALNTTAIALVCTRFCFMLLLCLIFDFRDIEIDKIHSVSTLATDIGRPRLKIIMLILFIVYFLCGMFLRFYISDPAQVISFVITGLLTWIVFQLSLTKRGYVFYYFIVDGLMLFSSLLTYLATI